MPGRFGGVGMEIQFEKSGGYAGIRRPATTIPVNSLPAAEAAEWRRLVEDADFFNLPERLPAAPGADRFQYQVTVDMDGGRHSVQVTEGAIPPALKPLIDRLKRQPSAR
jgi:hypothetical protein